MLGVNNDSQEVIKAITAVQQDIKHMSKQIDAIADISEKSIRNEESTKSAHKRIDEVEVSIDVMKNDQKWLWRTVGAAFISILGSIVTFVITKLF